MSEVQLSLTSEERDCLVNLLEENLKEARIEEHRTKKSSYREMIVHQEAVIEGLLNKLGVTV